MRPTRPTWPHLSHLLVVALLLVVAAVGIVRGIDLVRHGWRPEAPGEHRWLEWATGNPEERALRAELAGLSVGREPVVLKVLADGPVRADWCHVMAQYEWPASRVLAVEVVGQGRSGPPADALPAAREVQVKARDGMPTPGLETALPGSTVALFGLALVAAGLWLFARPSRVGPAADGSSYDRDALAQSLGGKLADGVLLAMAALFGWKVLAAPLWSWDHYAIWGMKARRLAELARLGGVPGDWLAGPAFPYAATDYPLGWPWLLSVASPHGAPGPALFKSAHLLCGLALALLVREAVWRGSGHRLAAATAGALTAASPLVWDTESLGLADLPLATLAMVAMVSIVTTSVVEASAGAKAPRWSLVVAGAALGGLPWIKQEGWTLAVWLLLAAGLLLGTRPEGVRPWKRLRRLVPLALPCLSLWALQLWVHARFTSPATRFLGGDWRGRAVDRLPDLPSILGRMAMELARPAWLGLWGLFAIALAVALLRRRKLAAFVGAVVVAQIGVYAAVYLATYLDPSAHIRSSFFRIAAALGPLAVVTVFLGLSRPAADILKVR